MKCRTAPLALLFTIAVLGGCAHVMPSFNSTYLAATPESPGQRIDLTQQVADKVAVKQNGFWHRSVSYLPVSLYWLDEERLLFNVRSGDDADTLVHSYVINPNTGEIRPLANAEGAALTSDIEKRVSLVSTDSALGDILKAVAIMAVSIAARSSSGGGSSFEHYAGGAENNGTPLSFKIAIKPDKHWGGARYYDCKFSVKNARTGKTFEDRSEIERGEVDYERKKTTQVYELKEWVRSWRVSPDGRYYLIGKTATLIDPDGSSSTALIENLEAGYAGFDVNPQWDKIALLKVERDERTQRLNYVVEFFRFRYGNAMPDRRGG